MTKKEMAYNLCQNVVGMILAGKRQKFNIEEENRYELF